MLVDCLVKWQVKFNVEKIKIDSKWTKNSRKESIVSKKLQCLVEMSTSDCQKTQKHCWTGIPGHPCCSLPEHLSWEQGIWWVFGLFHCSHSSSSSAPSRKSCRSTVGFGPAVCEHWALGWLGVTPAPQAHWCGHGVTGSAGVGLGSLGSSLTLLCSVSLCRSCTSRALCWSLPQGWING